MHRCGGELLSEGRGLSVDVCTQIRSEHAFGAVASEPLPDLLRETHLGL